MDPTAMFSPEEGALSVEQVGILLRVFPIAFLRGLSDGTAVFAVA
jgi:hypothetical protein